MRRPLMNLLMALPAVLASMPAVAQATAERAGYGHYGWDLGWGHVLFGSAMMILMWGGIILVIVLAVRWLGGVSSPDATPTTVGGNALEILKARFARGEIDLEEFEQRRRLLTD